MINNFYSFDKKEYVLKENKEFLSLLKEYQKYNGEVNLEFMNNLMQKLTSFYEFKLPNALFNGSVSKESEDYEELLKLAKLLGMNQLRMRLHHDENEFLESKYAEYVSLERHLDPKTFPYVNKRTYYIRIENGLINPYDLRSLEEFCSSSNKVLSPKDLYTNLAHVNDIDTKDLKRVLDAHNYNLLLRKKMIELTALQILYSSKTLPIYSYYRAKEFIKDFNEEYDLNIDSSYLDEIMDIDYQNIIPKGSKRTLLPTKDNETD